MSDQTQTSRPDVWVELSKPGCASEWDTNRMTLPELVAYLRRLELGASPGEWLIDATGMHESFLAVRRDDSLRYRILFYGGLDGDQKLVRAMREALPRLLEAAEKTIAAEAAEAERRCRRVP